MHKLLPAIVFTLLVSGCAMPFSVSVASFALDGLSYASTGKSITDHGLSMVVDKDCALLRGFTEGHICREDMNGPVLVANADPFIAGDQRASIAPLYLDVM